MNKDLLKFAVKLFAGMVAIGTGGTLVKKAGDDAGRIKIKGGKTNLKVYGLEPDAELYKGEPHS